MRRRRPWLHRAKTRVVHLANESFAFESCAGGQRLLVALNLGSRAELPAPGIRSILFGRDADLIAGSPEPKVRLGEIGWAVLSPEASGL